MCDSDMGICTVIQIAAVVLTVTVTGARGCYCVGVSELFNFCRADYVAVVYVLEVFPAPSRFDDTEYDMAVFLEYKMNRAALPFFTNETGARLPVVRTRSPPTSVCGFHFEEDEIYIISGSVSNGLRLGNCYWIQNIEDPKISKPKLNILYQTDPDQCDIFSVATHMP